MAAAAAKENVGEGTLDASALNSEELVLPLVEAALSELAAQGNAASAAALMPMMQRANTLSCSSAAWSASRKGNSAESSEEAMSAAAIAFRACARAAGD